jgi:hypothetical protein
MEILNACVALKAYQEKKHIEIMINEVSADVMTVQICCDITGRVLAKANISSKEMNDFIDLFKKKEKKK